MWKLCFFLIIMRMFLNKGVYESLICEKFTVISFTKFLWLRIVWLLENRLTLFLWGWFVWCYHKWKWLWFNEWNGSLHEMVLSFEWAKSFTAKNQTKWQLMWVLAVMELTGSEGNMLVPIATRDRKWLKLKPWCDFYGSILGSRQDEHNSSAVVCLCLKTGHI